MPQMRAVMSGASENFLPRRKASKNLGGSKIVSLTSATLPSFTRTKSAPSPSTLASWSTLMTLLLMSITLLPEGNRIGIESPEREHDVMVALAELFEMSAKRRRIRILHRSVAAVAAAVIRRAERTAPRLRDRSETGELLCHHDTDCPPELAFHADAVGGNVRLPAVQERADR